MEITIVRGDVVVCGFKGDYGKPRPAVVVQCNLFNETHASITVCPITSLLVDASLFRLSLSAGKNNGLKKPSQIMVDKLMTLQREKIHQKIGKLSAEQMHHLDDALRLWLGLIG